MSNPADCAKTLLLVDDEPSILSSLRRLLRPDGYTIHLAESGAAGLELLAREPIDLVMSDMRMPGMSGAEFLDHVRQQWPDAMRLLLTGYADVGSTIDAINRGEIYRYIAKPWDDQDLRLVVREALQTQTLRQENARLLALSQAQNQQLQGINGKLEQQVAQRTRELSQLNSFLNLANIKLKQQFLVSVKMFTGLLELRGSHMAGHSRRVAEQTRRLGEHMKLEPRQLHDLFLAGLLHDIGKIGLSDSLLSRPVSRMSGLDKTEYNKHAADGAAALMPLDDLKDVAQIVRAHHERFDGHGFPDGLIADEIPLGARLLSVVNDYDGLQIGTLSERHPRPEEARAILLQGRGKLYDPTVLDAFIDMLLTVKPQAPHHRTVVMDQLEPGMVLLQDLVSPTGALLLAADAELDAATVRRLQDYAQAQQLNMDLHVRTAH